MKVILAVSFFLLGCRTGCEALTGLTLSMIFFRLIVAVMVKWMRRNRE